MSKFSIIQVAIITLTDFFDRNVPSKIPFPFLEILISKQMVQASLFSVLLSILRKRKYNSLKEGFRQKKSVKVITSGLLFQSKYRIVANASSSRFEAHVGLFRLLMKGIFDPYVL
jgi:hypothetical protein